MFQAKEAVAAGYFSSEAPRLISASLKKEKLWKAEKCGCRQRSTSTMSFFHSSLDSFFEPSVTEKKLSWIVTARNLDFSELTDFGQACSSAATLRRVFV